MKTPSLSVRSRLLLTTCFLAITAVSSPCAESAFSKLVVFGDSLNDRGNMLQYTRGTFPAPPTYALGRQSDGPVWVEYLARELNLADKIVNYAVVGAMTKPAPGFPTGNVWSETFPGLEGTDVTTQVGDYLADNQGVADPAALHILEGGANDFPRVADPTVIIRHLIESLVTLERAGARHILLVNLPDIGKTPRVILGEAMGLVPAGTGVAVSLATSQLNQALLGALPAYTLPGVSVTLADAHGFMNHVTANAAAYGLIDVQRPYVLFGAGSDPSTWLFWDDLHPTTRGYAIFAAQVANSLVRHYSPGQGNIGRGAVNGLKGLVKTPGR